MARIRMIKPEFFDDKVTGKLSGDAALFFIGMWTQADREGRLEDDMERLKVRIFPYRAVDVEALAVELHGQDLIRRYLDADGNGQIWIPKFTKHQRPHPREPQSLIAACPNPAVKKHGEPCKDTAGPSESGIRNLENGIPPTLPAVAVVPGRALNGQTTTHRTGVLAGSLHRDHLPHAFCDETYSHCVPSAVHDKLANLLAPKYRGDRAEAKAALRAWYPQVTQTLSADFVMGDAFRFWQGRFDLHFASKPPDQLSVVVALAKPRGCTHKPPCRSDVDHTNRYLAEQRAFAGPSVGTSA